MRWRGRRGSDNVEDRRSSKGPAMAGGGSIVGILFIMLLVWLLGGDPMAILRGLAVQQPGGGGGAPAQVNPADDQRAQFVSVVLADTEDVWGQQFQQIGKQYRDPKLVLFRETVQSACGFQQAATGPFYCPLDQKVYIDLSFFDEMDNNLGAEGDFAQAYVIAHEVGHHVQNLLGVSEEIHRKRTQVGKEEANELSVRQELQADFYAGVWAHHAQQNWNILEEGDIEEAMNAATAIGDDRLQMQSRGYVVPESFTHGSSKQRAKWFYKGLKTGDMDQGDTYSIPYSQL
ncbi:KPN_02809 family neutral zinc metallopeptidase [Bremerella alba]|uniref:Neutral zinc metallopeptidase n=1 Tax=Bremerella alba TaxID=980252 RepID=A0A7V8V7S5_9BACT|nr:neutral zinc metallopeptidase [Bremerella alba]MBA2116534.1 hypothetical protein [Bremerella alba]